MRSVPSEALEKARVAIPAGAPYHSPRGVMWGAFQWGQLKILSSGDGDGTEWEHVSISRNDRCPTWDEMSKVKALFWDDTETVIQYHQPKAEHVNFHPTCLHLWRWTSGVFPMPPSILVGPKGGF